MVADYLKETLRTANQAFEAGMRAAKADSGWRSIASAPKDGNDFLAYGYWAGEINGRNPTPTICVIRWDGGSTDYPGYDWQVAHSDAYAEWFKPTHWRPLPTPPEGAEP